MRLRCVDFGPLLHSGPALLGFFVQKTTLPRNPALIVRLPAQLMKGRRSKIGIGKHIIIFKKRKEKKRDEIHLSQRPLVITNKMLSVRIPYVIQEI